MINNVKWPQELEDALVAWFSHKQHDGYYLSVGLIAIKMEMPRSAVVGKVKRLKLTRDETIPYISHQGRVIDPTITNFRPKMTKTPTSTKVTAPRAFVGPGEYVGVMTPTAIGILESTDHTCKFPIGHVGQEGFHMCGSFTAKGPYCVMHAAICYEPLRSRPRTRPSYHSR